MRNGNWSKVREILEHVLADGQEHSYAELKEAVRAKEPALLTSANTVNAVLYEMMKADACYTRPRKATYQYKENTPTLLRPIDSYLSQISEVVQGIENGLTSCSYDLSEAEFGQQKRLYQLGKELRQLLRRYR